MHKLKYCTLALVVALGAIACRGVADSGSAVNTDTAADGEAATGSETAPGTRAATVTAPGAETPHVTGQQIADLLDDPDIFLLDVRNPDELPEQGAIEGYTLIPIDELADRLDELPRDKKILTL